jgi:hypothetical protein
VLGVDPVATDRIAIDRYLQVGAFDSGIDAVAYVNAGETVYRVGVADLARIDVVTVTV